MESITVTLGGKATIVRVSELYKELLDAREKGNQIVINAQQVEQVDTAALQMLYSFHRLLKEEHGQMEWQDPSQNLINAATILGLSEQLNLPKADIQ